MRFQLHPDGQVSIHSTLGNDLLYMEARAQFEADLGSALPLPAGMVAIAYDADVLVLTYFDAKGNASPLQGNAAWAPGDAAIAALDRLLTVQQARLNPPVPPPTPEQLAELVRIAAIRANLLALTVGASPPATLAQLQAMSRDQFVTWWAANVTNQAQAVVALRELMRLVLFLSRLPI